MIIRALIALLLLLPLISTQAQTSPPADNPFGVVEGFWFPDVTCELGVSWERLIFDWSHHQPEGPDDWYTLNVDDRWLKAADQCDREIVALLKVTPEWATDGVPAVGVPNGLYLPHDDPDNVWAAFVHRAADYYRSRGVRHFIIWNEPDISSDTYGYEFAGTLEDYAQMLKVAYLAAKDANPAAVIHLAGTTYWHDVNEGREPFFTRLVDHLMTLPDAAEHGYYFDVLSLHIYFRTDSVYDIVAEMRAMLDERGLTDKRIWINETNAAPTDDPAWMVERPQFNLDLDHQAAFLVQAAALGLSAGAERIAAYKLYDQSLPPGGESFGLLSPPDASPRPAYYAWRMVSQHFRQVISAELSRNDAYSAVRLVRRDGQMLQVLWANEAENVAVTVGATAEKAYLFDHRGNMTVVRPVNGVYNLTLGAAHCDDREGCYLGGPVRVLLQPHDESTIREANTGTN